MIKRPLGTILMKTAQKPQRDRTSSGQSAVIQPKKAGLGQPPVQNQVKQRPQAPPVYRPQQANKLVQPKISGAPEVRESPGAPPIYRPQPAPKVLPAKRPASHQPILQPRGAPTAPPVYRPHPTPAVLRKAGAGVQNQAQRCTVTRPGSETTLARPGSSAAKASPASARAKNSACGPGRPIPGRYSAIQRATTTESSMYNLPFGGDGDDGEDPSKKKEHPKSHYFDKLDLKKRLRKSTQKKTAHLLLNKISPSSSKKNTRAKRKREEEEARFEKQGILYLPPRVPTHDFQGRRIWDGHRNSIHWYPGFTDKWWTAHGPKNHTQCVFYSDGACGGDMQIDHKQPAVDYILNQTGVAPEEVCDGEHHWQAFILDNATTINSTHPLNPSSNDTVRTAYHHEDNLQAMCAHHNASKGSDRKGFDDPHPPEYVGPCPGDECELKNGEPSKKVRRTVTRKDVKS